jgi:preprotein translocase subunit SecG
MQTFSLMYMVSIETAQESPVSNAISAKYNNSSSGSESVSTNLNIVIGAAVGGALFLISAIGIVWIVRQRNRTTTNQKNGISATSDIVVPYPDSNSIQVRTSCTMTEHFFSVI